MSFSNEPSQTRHPYTGFSGAKPIPFEEYSERFKEWFTMKRENGIIEVRMHTNGDFAVWNYAHHNGWGKVLKAIGQDPENEVLILGGEGERWFGGLDDEMLSYSMKCFNEDMHEYRISSYDFQYVDGGDLLWTLLYDIHIPTIACINGPTTGHTEFPLVCDLTLCTPDANFIEPHFASLGTATGDGLYLVFQEVFGYKRANKMCMLGESIGAQEAYDCGAVTEIVEREKIYDRAWELARFLMTKSRAGRRLQHEVMIQKWRRVINADFNMQFMAECWEQCMADPEELRKSTMKIGDPRNKDHEAGDALQNTKTEV